jgi:hypothetical protein
MWHCDSIQMVDRPFSQSPKCRINQLTAERDAAIASEQKIRGAWNRLHNWAYNNAPGDLGRTVLGQMETALTASTGSQPCQQPLDK